MYGKFILLRCENINSDILTISKLKNYGTD